MTVSPDMPSPAAAERFSVAVLVDLELIESGGGHVKCWQRFAEAAVERGDSVDLTLYFLGTEAQRIPISDTVRYILLPARFSTRRLGIRVQGAGHTDLALFHPRLARALDRYDVLHVTDPFAFGRTAARVARRRGTPLVASMHTDLVRLTGAYADEIFAGMLGRGRLSRLVLHTVPLRAAAIRLIQASVMGILRRCDHVMIGRDPYAKALAPLIGADRLSRLRRGIDKERFHPRHRDRAKLTARFQIPEDCPVLLFVGRLDASKNVMIAAETARALIDRGHRLRFLAIGAGSQHAQIRRLLGPHAVLPGLLRQDELTWIYPSADAFLFPSETEVFANVVLEARASGLPVVVAESPGVAQSIGESGVDGLIVDTGDRQAWVDAVETLIIDEPRRRAIGRRARQVIETSWPTWQEVLDGDLLPVWRRLAGLHRGQSGDAGAALTEPLAESPAATPCNIGRFRRDG